MTMDLSKPVLKIDRPVSDAELAALVVKTMARAEQSGATKISPREYWGQPGRFLRSDAPVVAPESFAGRRSGRP